MAEVAELRRRVDPQRLVDSLAEQMYRELKQADPIETRSGVQPCVSPPPVAADDG